MPASAAPHHFHPSLLREYDIRGIVGETLSMPTLRRSAAASGPWSGAPAGGGCAWASTAG
jgi:hypothetical protein